MAKTVERLQEFSIPLIAGVILAVIWANVNPHSYHAAVHAPFHHFGDWIHAGPAIAANHDSWTHFFTLHFLINDVFMVVFFGIAAKEITESCLPNGALNPVSKAINPLFATAGGVIGPVAMFLGLNAAFGRPEWINGWGVPTATDIALAWLVVRCLFGKSHPAVSFLLLLAVADDAIGLGIIAIGYPDPNHPTQWGQLLWLIPGMATAWGLRRRQVQNWVPYILIGGGLAWWGLYSAHLHPALALVFIVPFLPGPSQDHGLFQERAQAHRHSPLEAFEHDLKRLVDFGLFFFALANAGVAFSEVNGLSWIILASLIAGKTIGITSFSLVAHWIGFRLPPGMTAGHVVVTSVIAGLGLTVALFVSGQAFTDPALQGAARMGAVFSVAAAGLAVLVRNAFRIEKAAGELIETLAATPEPEPVSK
ncbi:MAG: Na+/H+ antiporter NhaA [Planctomycetaceae bacterium]|jgi:NhaA family Na+:H+ antiporter